MVLELLQMLSISFRVGLLVVVVYLSTACAWYWKRRSQLGFPPGPPCLPIVGSLPWIGLKPTASFPKLREKYGDVFTIYVFSKPVVVLASYEAIKEALVEKADTFSDRADFIINTASKTQGVIFTNGQLWRDSRRFCVRALKDFGIGKYSLEGKVMEEVKTCIDEFMKQNNQLFDPHFIIGRCVSNVICSVIFGQRFQFNDPLLLQFLQQMNENWRNSSKQVMIDCFPFLKYVPGDPACYKLLSSTTRLMSNFVDEHIRHHRESFDPKHVRDFIDAYLKEEAEGAEHWCEKFFADNQLQRMIFDMFEAETETITTTLRWGLLFLMQHENVQTKVQNEIDAVIGSSRLPSLSDRVAMPYTEATIMEIQRYADIVPGDVPHAVSKDCTFRGYHIPAGTMVTPHLSSALRDNKVFKSPHEFDPGNFLDENQKVKKPEQFIPFSTGSRVCLGESLAKMELFLFLTSLLQRFTFRPPEGKPLPCSERYEALVIFPVPFECRALEKV